MLRRRRESRRSNGMLPLFAVHAASTYYILDRKPPVTAGLIAANTLIYLRPDFLDPILLSLQEVSFNPHLILKNGNLNWKRFYLSPFYHVEESHLVYNMTSLLWTGIKLESSMGSAEFAAMVVRLLGLSNGIHVLISKSLLVFFDYEWAYYSAYSVGFSGVLFAMKVVLNSQPGNDNYAYGFRVPSRYAVWAELAISQLLIPRVSFLGHLSGILAGLLYVHLRGSYNGSDPTAEGFTLCFSIIRSLTDVLKWPLRFLQGLFPLQQRRISGTGRVAGGQEATAVSGFWRCRACINDNFGWLDVCERCSTNRRGKGNGTGNGMAQPSPRSPQYSGDLTLEQLRQRRMDRFGA